MLNKVFLMGHLGQDPRMSYTRNGTAVVNFNLATTERRRDAEGKMSEFAEWHKIVAWGKLAEACNNYLRKGDLVWIEGKLQTSKWQDQNGVNRYTTEIVLNAMKIVPRRGPQQPQNQQGAYQAPVPQQVPGEAVPPQPAPPMYQAAPTQPAPPVATPQQPIMHPSYGAFNNPTVDEDVPF